MSQVLALVEGGTRLKDAAKEVASHTGLSKNELYAAAIAGRGSHKQKGAPAIRPERYVLHRRQFTAPSIPSGTWGKCFSL